MVKHHTMRINVNEHKGKSAAMQYKDNDQVEYTVELCVISEIVTQGACAPPPPSFVFGDSAPHAFVQGVLKKILKLYIVLQF